MAETLGLSSQEMGISSEQEIVPEKEEEKPIDALVVFGFGIRSDQDLEEMAMGRRIRAAEKSKNERGWQLPLGAKLRTVAAAEMYHAGEVEDVIFTGGKSPAKQKEGIEQSEAELMERYFLHIVGKRKRSDLIRLARERGADPDALKDQIEAAVGNYKQDTRRHILREDKSSNTIENFANTINFLGANKTRYRNVALLSSDFHVDRILQLAEKFKVGGMGMGAEAAVVTKQPKYQKIIERYSSVEGNKKYRDEVLSELEDRDRGIAEARLGTSAEDYEKGERRWSAGLEQIPEYWMQGLQFIKTPDHLKGILRAEEGVQRVLRERHGIENIDEASIEDIRTALAETERIMPPKEWGEKEKGEK